MPVTQFNGVTLIRQNVDLKCETDQPKFVEARAEVSESEGYFCNIRYIGSSRSGHKETPQKARITASVSSTAKSSGKADSKLYKTDLPTFDVTLVGRLVVDKKYKKGIKIGQYSRSKKLVVHSLTDLDVKKTLDDKTLRVQRTRDRDSNKHTISLTVPSSVSEPFNSEVTLVNRVN